MNIDMHHIVLFAAGIQVVSGVYVRAKLGTGCVESAGVGGSHQSASYGVRSIVQIPDAFQVIWNVPAELA